MPLRARTLCLVPLLALLTSCEPVSVEPEFPPGVNITFGTWYSHEADDAPLPAKITTRIVGVALEETFLDSARLIVNANGTYDQRYWLRVNITGNLDREETVIDLGIWSGSTGNYTFTSQVRNRTFTVSTPIDGVLNTFERMVFWADSPGNLGTYSLTPP